MNFLKIYRRLKDVFVKPKLKWYFGSWKKEHNLPVWRRGPQIRIAKYHQMYIPQECVTLFDGYSEDGYKCYSHSKHKLPVKPWTYVWKSNIRKKLRKWHLSWIPPIIQLPIWMSFHFYDRDIYWKTKWDEYRYEYPAHITLVFFGLALSVTAYIPDINGNTTQDDYWESLLTYNGDLKNTNEKMGWWRTFEFGEPVKYSFRFNPDFLKEPYRSELIKIQTENPIKYD